MSLNKTKRMLETHTIELWLSPGAHSCSAQGTESCLLWGLRPLRSVSPLVTAMYCAHTPRGCCTAHFCETPFPGAHFVTARHPEKGPHVQLLLLFQQTRDHHHGRPSLTLEKERQTGLRETRSATAYWLHERSCSKGAAGHAGDV